MRVVLVHDKVGRCARVLVLGVLGQRTHQAAACAVVGDGFLDDHALGDRRGLRPDLLGITIDALGLLAVYRRALDLGFHLKLGPFGLIGWVQHIGAHVIQALTGLFRALDVAAPALVVGAVEAPHAGVTMHPAVGHAQIKHLPVQKPDGLTGQRAAHLRTLQKPTHNAVGAGLVKDPREVIGALAFEVVQMALAG